MPSVTANGVELYYEWRGPEGAPVVVFLNGLLTDLSSWAPHLPLFSDRYRCLVYDCRGQGRSGKPDQRYTTRDHAADLAALCDALDLAPAIFVGLSNGGAALLHFAAEHPERVRALVLSGVNAHADALLQAKLRSWVSAMEAGSAPLRFDVSMPWVWGGRFLQANYERIMKYRDRALLMPVEAAINLIRGAMDHDARGALGRIAAPTLLVVGAEDVLTPRWIHEDLALRIPNARLAIMPGAGHAAVLESPEEFSVLAHAFIDELS